MFSRTAKNFYPRSPCGERHNVRPDTRQRDAISIHALLAESDLFLIGQYLVSSNFYPRSPCGERRCFLCGSSRQTLFLSTLSLRRATRKNLVNGICRIISIHALLAESDGVYWYSYATTPEISIHALLAESDAEVDAGGLFDCDFYPRSPCGERPRSQPTLSAHQYFYPRSPCGERREAGRQHHRQLPISIHALLAESDYQYTLAVAETGVFLSTLSLRRATWIPNRSQNPFLFLSTLSLRRATARCPCC